MKKELVVLVMAAMMIPSLLIITQLPQDITASVGTVKPVGMKPVEVKPVEKTYTSPVDTSDTASDPIVYCDALERWIKAKHPEHGFLARTMILANAREKGLCREGDYK